MGKGGTDGKSLLAGSPSGRWRDSPQCIFRSEFSKLKLCYFEDTDTLYIELNDIGTAETRDLDENTLLDFDADGLFVSLTIEHASIATDIRNLQISGFTN